ALADADVRALFGPSEDGMMRRVFPEGSETALAAYFEEFTRMLPACEPLHPELRAALLLLRERRVPTALVTGKARVTALLSLRHFGMEDLFDAVETGSPEGGVKRPAIRGLLERWRVTPAEAIYVGDAASDMLDARDVGAVGVGAAWSGGSAAELAAAGAGHVFTDPREFLGWLRART
ncbi:MAG TPA: HAD hydrolase-like protein, partial [Methylomirabilota bacterium]|nr:HAD hydrolase-like protein [Methylomirabilota bacterium]